MKTIKEIEGGCETSFCEDCGSFDYDLDVHNEGCSCGTGGWVNCGSVNLDEDRVAYCIECKATLKAKKEVLKLIGDFFNEQLDKRNYDSVWLKVEELKLRITGGQSK